MSDAKQYLHRAHSEAAEKYIYFLLAAAGAAIAVAVGQTQNEVVTWSKVPLALAVGSWGLSFYFGCRQLRETSNIMQQNYQLLRVHEGSHPQFPPYSAPAISQSIDEQVERSGRWGKWQFKMLVAGASLYVAWHILEMYLRTAAGLDAT